MSTPKPLKTTFPIFLSLLFVMGYGFYLRAQTPSKMQFTADTILQIEGTARGDLLISQSSGCDSINISGKEVTVSSLSPSGFTLKTPSHSRALSVSSTASPVNLSFSSDSLAGGEISTWTVSALDPSAGFSAIWSVPKPNTQYSIKANGKVFQTLSSNSQSELSFTYSQNLQSPAVFTLELYTGGAAFTPVKPDVSQTDLTPSPQDGITLQNVPKDAYQIAVSHTPDFKDASWDNFDAEKLKTLGETNETLYVKFRNKKGGVSDVIVYTPSSSVALNDGDIVKTSDNPDVYILKHKNNKKYKRLILSPSVFNSYRHLKWENIKTVSQQELDAYTTSNLVQVSGDNTIYALYPQGDTGKKKVLDLSSTYDSDSVYEINSVDRDSYGLEG